MFEVLEWTGYLYIVGVVIASLVWSHWRSILDFPKMSTPQGFVAMLFYVIVWPFAVMYVLFRVNTRKAPR